jgi:hypothetical protein
MELIALANESTIQTTSFTNDIFVPLYSANLPCSEAPHDGLTSLLQRKLYAGLIAFCFALFRYENFAQAALQSM